MEKLAWEVNKFPSTTYWNPLFIIVLFVFAVILTPVLLGIVFFLKNPHFEARLWRTYLAISHLSRAEIIAQFGDECKKINFEAATQNAKYNLFLKESIATKLGISDTKKLLFIYDNKPDLRGCNLVWIVDRNGVGFAGYEDIKGKFIVRNGYLPKNEVDIIFADLPI